MPSLQKIIAEKFLAALAASEEIDTDKVEKIRELLARGKKPKADELVKIFTAPRGGDVQ